MQFPKKNSLSLYYYINNDNTLLESFHFIKCIESKFLPIFFCLSIRGTKCDEI